MVQPTSQVIAQCVLAKSACMRRDSEAALRFAQEGIRLSQSYGQSLWQGMASAFHGWALSDRGECVQGLAELREGTAAWRATGNRHFTPFLLALQAEAALKAHEPEAARAALADGLVIASGGGDVYWLAELHRLAGELSWAAGEDGGAVEACFCEAQATARQQEAKTLELRAAVSLARLWRSQGKIQAAREMLSEIYGWFTEGFATSDLQAASALLAEL
jgi:adenylate cyclase